MSAVTELARDPFAFVGSTPQHRYDSAIASILIKTEGDNPTGSVKDRACVEMLRHALDVGDLVPGLTVLDASSGNMACSLAYFSALLGFPCTVVCGTKLTNEKRDFIRCYGATLIEYGGFTIEGNRYCAELVRQEPGKYCFVDQFHNWQNPAAHFRTTGPEILRDTPNVGTVVASLGSGGTLLGTGEFLKSVRPSVRIVAVEAASGTRIPGTAAFVDGDYQTPFIVKGFEDHVFDESVQVSETDAIATTKELLPAGVFGGVQTGGVVHVATMIAARPETVGDVVAISGDSGWKNLGKLLVTAAPRQEVPAQ